MKTTSILLAVALSIVSVAWAEAPEQNNQQQLSKRPYAKSPVKKDMTYEGDATYEESNAKAEKNYKTLQLHMLGRRPYAEKNSD